MKRTVTFTTEQIDAYAEASGDRNPIHLDDAFARSVGLPGRIAHGMLQMGVAGTLAAEAAGGVARLKRLQCRFAQFCQVIVDRNLMKTLKDPRIDQRQ